MLEVSRSIGGSIEILFGENLKEVFAYIFTLAVFVTSVFELTGRAGSTKQKVFGERKSHNSNLQNQCSYKSPF